MKNRIVLLIAAAVVALGIAASAPAEARTDFTFALSFGDYRVHPGYGGHFYVAPHHRYNNYDHFYYRRQPHRMETRWWWHHERREYTQVYYVPGYMPYPNVYYYAVRPTVPPTHYYYPAPPAYAPAPQRPWAQCPNGTPAQWRGATQEVGQVRDHWYCP
jgi:hypothetical protein